MLLLRNGSAYVCVYISCCMAVRAFTLRACHHCRWALRLIRFVLLYICSFIYVYVCVLYILLLLNLYNMYEST